jgi:hypothetical protein
MPHLRLSKVILVHLVAPGFIVAQLIGAVAAAYLFGWLFAPAADVSVSGLGYAEAKGPLLALSGR